MPSAQLFVHTRTHGRPGRPGETQPLAVPMAQLFVHGRRRSRPRPAANPTTRGAAPGPRSPSSSPRPTHDRHKHLRQKHLREKPTRESHPRHQIREENPIREEGTGQRKNRATRPLPHQALETGHPPNQSDRSHKEPGGKPLRPAVLHPAQRHPGGRPGLLALVVLPQRQRSPAPEGGSPLNRAHNEGHRSFDPRHFQPGGSRSPSPPASGP